MELAVETMRKGAFDFLTKPFSAENLKAVIQRAARHTALRRENDLLRSAVGKLTGQSEIRGRAHASRAREMIPRRPHRGHGAHHRRSRNGKELVARAIHKASACAARPLVSVNCAASLRRFWKASFRPRKGRLYRRRPDSPRPFETAHQGTLFLDEAGEMSPAAQAKLLRVLAEGKITRVGSSVTRDVDVRVLVATHRNLVREVEEGGFVRISTTAWPLSPSRCRRFRERAEDIPELADYLLSDRQRTEDPKRVLDPDTLPQLPPATLGTSASFAISSSAPASYQRQGNRLD